MVVVVVVLVAVLVFVAVLVAGFLLLVVGCWLCWLCWRADVLMRCVVTWVVHEFIFEPNSRSGGRSAAVSEFEQT